MEESLGLLFYPKKPKGYLQGDVPIYFRITVNKIEREISSKFSVDPLKWSTQANRLSGRSEAVKAVNDYLDLLQTKAINARTKLITLGKPVTAENIKLLVLDKLLEPARMIMDVFRDHNKRMAELIPTGEYAPGTLERFETAKDHTISFMQDTYGISDIDIQKLDYGFISDYEHWLKTVRHCDHNTTMKYLTNFKKIVLICIKKKWLSGDPFGEFKITHRPKQKTPLSPIELERIATKVFNCERLTIVRDVFLFACYTGLAYADIKKLKRTDVFIGIDGYKWISVPRQKGQERNNSTSNIPLLPAAEAIMNKYWNDPFCVEKGVVFPVRSNQKTNEYLKEIADLCGIRIKLTFHIARHTFATTVALLNKVPIETVSRLLAHKKIATTQPYAQVLDNKVSDDMSALRGKFA